MHNYKEINKIGHFPFILYRTLFIAEFHHSGKNLMIGVGGGVGGWGINTENKTYK